ncbi:acetylornithine deacetylase, partial [Candidatus Bathyarchaeota archaeon]|nr:acetylornithine deacetylase [Candidatus Bathyarchaeota archaeon]
MNLEKVYEHIDVHANSFVEDLVMLVRQPSVSAKGEGIEECAVLVGKMLQEVGFSTKILRGEKGHPVVYGELKSQQSDRTLLF